MNFFSQIHFMQKDRLGDNVDLECLFLFSSSFLLPPSHAAPFLFMSAKMEEIHTFIIDE